MDWANYSTLKTAGAVSFTNEKVTTREAVEEVTDSDGNVVRVAQAKEEREFIALTEKRWDGSTGEAQADGKR